MTSKEIGSATMALLRELGYTVERVEQIIPRSYTRRDLFGSFDYLACHADFGILGVQVTTQDHIAEHRKKLSSEPRLVAWLQASGRAELWGWAKRGKKGQRKLWTVVIERAELVEGSVTWHRVGGKVLPVKREAITVKAGSNP